MKFFCWLPTAILVAVEIYARNFDGWGAWATAPLFLLPLVMSSLITLLLISQIVSEHKSGSIHTATIMYTCITLLPVLWLLVRRHFI